MKAIVVLSFELAEPEQVVDILAAIDPPSLPNFTGQARIAVGSDALAVVTWLDGKPDVPTVAWGLSDER